MNSPLPKIDDLLKSIAEDSLSHYIKQAWPIIEPGTEYLHNWHIDCIAEHLQSVDDGQIRRLIINIPPRYMKSIAVSVMWPTFSWIKNPELRWMFASYSAALSKKHSVDRRNIITSEWYESRWDHVCLAKDQNEKSRFMNTKQGVMVATSIGGSSTGMGGNRLIVDDAMNPEEAASDIKRESANDFFDQTLTSRLDDKKHGAIVVVMQRLHEIDLTGHLLEKGGWFHLRLPVESEGRTVITMPVSLREIVREDGELLWPERMGKKEIEEAKVDLGSFGYAGQMQQRPVPAGGGMIKSHWWKFWYHEGREPLPVMATTEDGTKVPCTQMPIPIVMDQWIQSWDMTFKETKDSDFVTGGVWARNRANKFLIDQVRAKMDFPSTIRAFTALTLKYPQCTTKLVEDKANGPAVISSLKDKISGIIAIEPAGSKEARVAAVSPQIEAGNVILPHPTIAPWIVQFILEHSAFPKGAKDDQVDQMSQAINYLPKHGLSMSDVEVFGESVFSDM